MKNIIVFYHKDCPDGFGAAWAAWKRLGSKAEYIGIEPRNSTLPVLKNKEIYFLDIGRSKSEMLGLLAINKGVVFIDHHISRRDIAEAMPESVFSLNHSGAYLAWKYFHGQKSVPKLILYIEDNDLWKFKIPYTKEIVAALDTRGFGFALWDKISGDFQNNERRVAYIKEGKAITKFQNAIVESIVHRVSENIIFEKHKAIAVNSSELASEIGDLVVRKKKLSPLCVIWHYQPGMIYFHLRSNKTVDVSKIAQKFGGGGHREAAGFDIKTTSLERFKFPWKRMR